MKMVFLDALTLGKDLDLAQLEDLGSLKVYQHTSKDQVIQRSVDAQIIITNKVYFTKDVLDQLPNLKMIAVTAVGLDNIDTEYAQKKKVVVKNVVGYSTDSVAQHTFASVLHFFNNQYLYDSLVKEGQWQSSPVFNKLQYPIESLKGKKWGIIGLGNIGKKVAQIANSFGAEVSYFSTSGKNKNSDYTHKELSELCLDSDIISIHCPLNKQTKNLLTANELSMMKPEVVLINVARGGIINEKDLVKSFNKGQMRLCLDVLEKEPLESNSEIQKILNSPRLLITPHIAWSAHCARELLLKGVIANIKAFVS